jgi:hypothetical protein
MNSGLIAAMDLGMRPIQPLVRLPHSHIGPDWQSTVERASRIAIVSRDSVIADYPKLDYDAGS